MSFLRIPTDKKAVQFLGSKKVHEALKAGRVGFWFGADSAEFDLSNIITNLVDKGPNNIQLTGIDGSPVYTPVNATFNNRPTINNNASVSQGYDIDNFNHTEDGGYTLMMVMKRATAGTRSLFDSQTPRFAIYNYHTTSSRYAWSDGTTRTDFGDAPPDTNVHVVAFVFDSVAGESRFYEDGILLGTGPYSAKNIAGATAFLKRPDALGGSVSFGGDWAEGIMYVEPLSAENMHKVGRRFARDYGINYLA